ncbi:MAG: hypothetical protein ACK44W_07100 [Planctomycetota bacterium]
MADPSDDKPAAPPPPGEEPSPGGSRGARIIDVQGMIRQASTRVRVDQLVRQGKKYISMLSRERIDELINQAVKTIVDKYRALAAGVSQVPVAQLQAESKQEFNELLEQYKETSRARTELEASKEALDSELTELRRELERQKALAEGRLAEDLEKALIVGFKEFERELDRVVAKVFEKRRLILQESESPEAVGELRQVEEVLRKIMARLVAAERERFQVAGGRDKEIALLEKRIEKLYAQIGALENALRTITSSKLYSNQQIQNLLRSLGLAQDDKYYEKKKEMLKVVLQSNKELRQKARELEEKGISLANPAGNVDGSAA